MCAQNRFKELKVKTMPLRKAKADFSAIIEAGKGLSPIEPPSLANHLLALPEVLEISRDKTPLRDFDFSHQESRSSTQ